MPSAAWLGVERIVVACDVTGASMPALRLQLCRTVADEARRQTRYPVVLGDPGADIGPPLGTARHDLTLRVVASVGQASELDIALHLVRRTLPQAIEAAPPIHFTVAAGQPRLLDPALRRAVDAILAPTPARPRRPIPTPTRAY